MITSKKSPGYFELTGNNVAVLKSLSSTNYVANMFWGDVVNSDSTNVGYDVTNIRRRKIIIKNNTNGAVSNVRIYAFLRNTDGTEITRATVDLANIAAAATLAVDDTNFPEIDGAWTHLLVRTLATSSTTGDVQVIYVNRGGL